MADYFETEEVVKGYDGALVRRILGYIKPYRLLCVIMIIALALSTLGELAIPIKMQRLIDDAILARYLLIRQHEELSLSPEALNALDILRTAKRRITVGENLFIPQDQDRSITAAAEEELRSAGILNGDQWYAFPFRAAIPPLR
jgi:hypothetical protein